MTPKFANNVFAQFLLANGDSTGANNSRITSITTPTGKLKFYDAVTSSNVFLYLGNSTGTFVTNTQIKGQTGGQTAVIKSIDNLKVNVINFTPGILAFDQTSITTFGKLATSASTRDASFEIINLGDNTEYSSDHYLLSKATEDASLNTKSIEMAVSMVSINRRMSPVIDLSRVSTTIVENLITTANTTLESVSTGGNAQARYITRKVTLADGQDAEDLKVYLTAYKPSTSDIDVYYKIVNSEDSDTFDEAVWTLMTKETASSVNSDSERKRDFKEFVYTIPSSKLTGPGGEVQYTNSQSITFTGYKYFAIKIVLSSTQSSNPPRVKDMRAIALQL